MYVLGKIETEKDNNKWSKINFLKESNCTSPKNVIAQSACIEVQKQTWLSV